jgi:hypothetical protein
MNKIQIFAASDAKKCPKISSCSGCMRHHIAAAVMASDTLMYCCSRDRRHALQLHQFIVLAE